MMEKMSKGIMYCTTTKAVGAGSDSGREVCECTQDAQESLTETMTFGQRLEEK